MFQQNEFAAGKAICNEIGGAVLEVLAQKRTFSVQSLIAILEEAQRDSYHYGPEREEGMEYAINILKRFK